MNTYTWGNFRGDPVALMEQHYDASLYVANWGSHQLMLWLPRSTLGQKTASRYCVDEEAFSMYPTRDHVLLTFDSDTEKPEDWDEGDGWLATLVPLQADIAAGDLLRARCLGWPLCVQQEGLNNDIVSRSFPLAWIIFQRRSRRWRSFCALTGTCSKRLRRLVQLCRWSHHRPIKSVDDYAPSRALKRMT